jgi:hypothetical protein
MGAAGVLLTHFSQRFSRVPPAPPAPTPDGPVVACAYDGVCVPLGVGTKHAVEALMRLNAVDAAYRALAEGLDAAAGDERASAGAGGADA